VLVFEGLKLVQKSSVLEKEISSRRGKEKN
jgi:hypothetical protein